MTKQEIWQWFKQRIASEYDTEATKVKLATNDAKYLAQELAQPDLETVFGTFVIEVEDSTGAMFRPSYGFYQKKEAGKVGEQSLIEEYFPGGDHTNTKKVKDNPQTNDLIFQNDADDYLESQGLITYTGSFQVLKSQKHLTVQAAHSGRDWSTLGLGTVTVVNNYHVWCDNWTGQGTGTWHYEKLKQGKTVSIMQTSGI